MDGAQEMYKLFYDRIHELARLKPAYSLEAGIREVEHWNDRDFVDSRKGLTVSRGTLYDQAVFALENLEIRYYMETDKKINAIKEMRMATDMGLKESKLAVEEAIRMLRNGYMSEDDRVALEDEVAQAVASITNAGAASPRVAPGGGSGA